MLKVGYIGLGAMGGALSAHVARQFDLMVFDRNPVAMDALAALGAKKAGSAEELARESDVVILCLPRSSDVEAALFGENGVAAHLGSGKIVIDQTSGVPEKTFAMAEKLQATGVSMMDAPLSGGIPAAQNGTVTIIASGSDRAWKVAGPILNSMSQKVYRCSDRVGDAQALKLANNAIGASYRMASLELVALGRKLGLELKDLVDNLNNSDAANFTTRYMLQGLLEGRSTTNFAMALMLKDLNEAMALNKSNRFALPMTSGARALMQVTYNLFGNENARLEDVIPATEKLADVKLAGENDLDSLADDAEKQQLLVAINAAMLTCNIASIGENVAMIRDFGLKIGELDRILNKGSAWSVATEKLLGPLSRGEAPEFGVTLGEAAEAAALVKSQAKAAYVPIMLPNAAFACLYKAIGQFGEDADIGQLAATFNL